MKELTDILGQTLLGNALDVATGQGYFIGVMAECCKRFDALVGEDTCLNDEEADSLAAALDVGLDRLQGNNEYKVMRARVEEVKARIRDIGVRRPTMLVVLGTK